jgi:Uncharacterized protein conserved in bacteria (DUF2252)
VLASFPRRVEAGARPASSGAPGGEGRRGSPPRSSSPSPRAHVKIKFALETFQAAEMTLFAQWCGYSLALSHARSGDPAVISGYLGKNDAFDKAIATFSIAYADQNEKDHAALKRAIRNGKVEAIFEKTK